MIQKPSYEELEQRIKELEKEATERNNAVRALSESEMKYAILVENLRAGIATIADSVLSYVNLAFCQFLGYSCEELIGTDFIAHVAPEYRDLVSKRGIDRMEGKKVPSKYEVELLKKDGSTLWVELDAKRISVGGKYASLIICRDTTQHRQAEKNLRKSEGRFRSIFEQAAVGVALSDTRSGQYLKVNQKYADIVGYTIEELLQLSFPEISHPDDIHEDLENLNKLVTGKIKSFTMDKRFLHKDGSVLWGRITVSPMWEKNALPDSHIAILEDITERKNLENEISNKNKLLEAVILQSPFPMGVVSAPDHRLQYVNSAAIELLGGDDENHIGKKMSEIQPTYTLYRPDGTELPKDEYPMFKALNQEKTVNKELIVERKDGTRRWYSVNAIPIYSDSGTHIAAFVVFPDITEQKEAEETVRESEKRYRSIMEASPDPIVTYDKQGNVLYVNPAFTRVFGWTYEEVTGDKIDYVPESNWPETQAMLERLNRGEGYFGFETQRYDKNRRIIDINMSFGVWKDRSGAPAGSVVILRDVGDQKKLEAQLRQALKMESIGTLAGGIAHDFNNILAAIIGYAELSMEQEVNNDKIPRFLERILQSGIRAKDLVQQILSFARTTDTGKSIISITPVIKEALKLLRATIPTTIEIFEHLNAKTDRINGSSTQIHQILMNLCTNAKFAMRNKRGILEVRLENTTLDEETAVGHFLLPPGEFLKLTVSDTGHGISPDQIEKIFDPYYTTKSKKEGTGMGLSIAHGIVKDHAGAIRVESQVGAGTEFEILLPVSIEEQYKEKNNVPLTFSGSGNILLVDDEENLVEAYGQMMEGLGYQVTGVTSSAEALVAFRNQPHHFNLVLADYTMPSMTGAQLATAILEIRSEIPIILYSGYAEDMTSQQAKQLGIKDLIEKPLNKNKLSNILRQYL